MEKGVGLYSVWETPSWPKFDCDNGLDEFGVVPESCLEIQLAG